MPSILIAFACLIAWLFLTFVRPVGIGAVHILLAVSAVVFVRWYALRDQRRAP